MIQIIADSQGVATNHYSDIIYPLRPRPIAPVFDDIPDELKAHNQWVLWYYEWRGGKWTKIPAQPDGARAKADDPETWSPFDYCETAYETTANQVIDGRIRLIDGIGFVLSSSDPFTGFDFDHCVDEDFNITDPRIADYVKRLNSYTELSPSAHGLRVIVRAKLPPRDRRIGNIECYDSGRFLSLTGVRFPHEWLNS